MLRKFKKCVSLLLVLGFALSMTPLNSFSLVADPFECGDESEVLFTDGEENGGESVGVGVGSIGIMPLSIIPLPWENIAINISGSADARINSADEVTWGKSRWDSAFDGTFSLLDKTGTIDLSPLSASSTSLYVQIIVGDTNQLNPALIKDIT